MVDLAEAPPVISAAAAGDTELTPARLKVAAICMIGMALGTTVLPFCVVDAVRGPMMLELGWGANQLSLSYALMLWAAAISVWPVGMLIDRFGARPVVTAGALGIGLVSLALPFVREFCQICILFSLLGVSGAVGLGYSKIVATLFFRRRGLALGISAAATSALGWVLPLAADRVVHAGGWRGAFEVLGFVALAVAPLLYLGLAQPACAAAKARAAEGTRTVDAARSRSFWLIVAAGLIAGLIGNVVLSDIGPAMAHRGFGDAADLRGSPIGMLATLAGSIIAGLLLDRLGTPAVALAAYLASGLTSLMWIFVGPGFGGTPALMAIFALGAFAFAAQLPMVGYFFSRYFGLRSFATVWGLQMFIQTVVMGAATSPFARLVNATATEPMVFLLGTVAPLAAAALYLLLPAYRYGATPEPGLATQPPGQSLHAFRTWWSRAPT